MPAVAALPALALLAGCAFALALPDFPPLAGIGVLAAATALAARAWHLAHPALLSAAVAAGFAAGGALLAADAWERAWHPTLRVAFDELARRERSEYETGDRRPSEDDTASAPITGVLRTDASTTPIGAALSLDVREIETPCPRAVSGGVLLTVVGEIARARVTEWRAGRVIHATAQLRRPSRYLDPGVPDQERLLLTLSRVVRQTPPLPNEEEVDHES